MVEINIILKFNILEEIMSREIIAEDHTIDGKESSKIISKKSKVDINILINKVRADQKKEKFENLIFIGLISAVIVISGLIISM